MNLERKVITRTLRDLHRGVNVIKKGYQPNTNLLKHDNGDLL
jgi:hypothetical protein